MSAYRRVIRFSNHACGVTWLQPCLHELCATASKACAKVCPEADPCGIRDLAEAHALRQLACVTADVAELEEHVARQLALPGKVESVVLSDFDRRVNLEERISGKSIGGPLGLAGGTPVR